MDYDKQTIKQTGTIVLLTIDKKYDKITYKGGKMETRARAAFPLQVTQRLNPTFRAHGVKPLEVWDARRMLLIAKNFSALTEQDREDLKEAARLIKSGIAIKIG